MMHCKALRLGAFWKLAKSIRGSITVLPCMSLFISKKPFSKGLLNSFAMSGS